MRKALPLLLGFTVAAGCSSGAGGGPGFGMMDDNVDDAGGVRTMGQGSGSTQNLADAASGMPGQTNPTPTVDASADDDVSTSATADAGDVDSSLPGTTHKDASTVGSEDSGSESGAAGATGETGRMIGMTAAHNMVRAMVSTTPALAPMTWSTALAQYAQQWATEQASNPTTCAGAMHRQMPALDGQPLGENLAQFFGGGFGGFGGGTANVSTAEQAVQAWASEKQCWTYGTILGTEQCNMSCSTMLHSDGCGHYTQVVWRRSTQLGCGVATCTSQGASVDIWICNYAPAGNVIGEAPY